VKESTFVELTTSIAAVNEMMTSFFDKLFKAYISLQKYMETSDVGIETVARKLDIWRQPTVNFDSSKVSYQ